MKFRTGSVTPDAERLAAALDSGAVAPETEPLVTIARALATPQVGSEEYHEETKQRMLRAFALAADPAPHTDDAGSRDGGATLVHTLEVALSDGGRVLLADVEPIDQARADAAVAGVALPVFDFMPDDRS